MKLRRYIYLDEPLTEEFASQLPEGFFKTERQTEIVSGDKGLAGQLGTSHANVSAKKTKANQRQTERTVEQRPETVLARIVNQLNESGELTKFSNLDQQVWEGFEVGEVLEVQANLSLSNLRRFADLAAQLNTMAQDLPPELAASMDADGQQTMESMSMLEPMIPRLPLLFTLTDAPEFKFAANLTQDWLRGASSDLEGEATVLLKVNRRLKSDEKFSFLESMSFARDLPRETRQEMLKNVSNTPDFPDAVIDPPAIVATVIAISK